MNTRSDRMGVGIWPKFGVVLQDRSALIRIYSELIGDQVLTDMRQTSFPTIVDAPRFHNEIQFRTPFDFSNAPSTTFNFAVVVGKKYETPKYLLERPVRVLFLRNYTTAYLQITSIVSANAVKIVIPLTTVRRMNLEILRIKEILNRYQRFDDAQGQMDVYVPRNYVSFEHFHDLLQMESRPVFKPNPTLDQILKNRLTYRIKIEQEKDLEFEKLDNGYVKVLKKSTTVILSPPLLGFFLERRGLVDDFITSSRKTVLEMF